MQIGTPKRKVNVQVEMTMLYQNFCKYYLFLFSRGCNYYFFSNYKILFQISKINKQNNARFCKIMWKSFYRNFETFTSFFIKIALSIEGITNSWMELPKRKNVTSKLFFKLILFFIWS